MTDFYKLVPAAPMGRYEGLSRPYAPADVERLRGSVEIHYSLAEMGANRLWRLLQEDGSVSARGALWGNRAMKRGGAGLRAISLWGGRAAAAPTPAPAMSPAQSLSPANAAPELARRINRTL